VGVLTSGANEGFSNAILEQMAVGLPMIVTAVGGNPEAVIEGENGFVIPPLDRMRLAEAMTRIYSDSACRESMGRQSRKHVEARFSLETMCREHAQLYRALCGQTR
jgi:L-malate glycosyltransferase